MMLKRTAYLGYYLKKMKWSLLKEFLAYASKDTGKSKAFLMKESIQSVYQYNISILEYFQFGFYNKTKEEKNKWAGTGTMYEFQKIANPIKERNILDDKRLFYIKYKEFFVHKMYTLEELKKRPELIDSLLVEENKVVLKEASGKCGVGVKICSTIDLTHQRLIEMMEQEKFDILETYIKQHSAIQELSPSAVNTIRIFTQIRKNGDYEVLGCRMRISVNCEVDNLAAGNLAAPINEKTGKINGPGIYSNVTKASEVIHPITKTPIVGFQIPYWEEILAMVKKASLKHSQNRSIGWDVVLTDQGPGLIEGNHDWCKLVWQLPINKGLKNRLDV
ncbi:sugar-transfer associated ATP-grasp domain-containing protein [Mesonia ostreae]|uniref:Sugar-transfer associated ATP-grasp domain-containing protein n=1 Tax=Mesonia ostreae TaxID=861110 RepID=A0ABU2KH78_9FLAO|nr:sugar-transfer associated ATP-grasp domain-containing protein [Mesonia ostreae]MDT0294057.1 sugar-transfer associated ATP-grasp domain-containing protein [Mesonia ostreae]